MSTSPRPPFVYYGGKSSLAARIAALLPTHSHYAEPFAGRSRYCWPSSP